MFVICQVNFTDLCMLHKCHVMYSIWYCLQFHVTAVGLGTYYPWTEVVFEGGKWGDRPRPRSFDKKTVVHKQEKIL